MNAHKHRAKSLLHSNSSTKVWAVCRYWFGVGKHFPFLIVVTVIHIVAAKLNVSLLLCYENYCCEQQSVAIYCTLRSLCLSFTVFNFHFFSTLFCFGRLLCVCVSHTFDDHLKLNRASVGSQWYARYDWFCDRGTTSSHSICLYFLRTLCCEKQICVPINVDKLVLWLWVFQNYVELWLCIFHLHAGIYTFIKWDNIKLAERWWEYNHSHFALSDN